MESTSPQPLLNPAQQHVLDVLAAKRDERPVFDATLGQRLRAQLEDGLSPLVPVLDTLGIEQLWVSKHKFASVLGRIVTELLVDGATPSAGELGRFRIDRPILLETDPATSWMV